MRKLAWFIIFVLIGLLIWAGLCLWQDWIAIASNDGLLWVGGGIWTGIVGIGNWIRLTASATNVAFLFYSLILLIGAVFFWAGMKKLWSWGATHRPHLKTPSLKSSGSLRDFNPQREPEEPEPSPILKATPKPVEEPAPSPPAKEEVEVTA